MRLKRQRPRAVTAQVADDLLAIAHKGGATRAAVLESGGTAMVAALGEDTDGRVGSGVGEGSLPEDGLVGSAGGDGGINLRRLDASGGGALTGGEEGGDEGDGGDFELHFGG